ncbi:amidase family protein [Acuticoccus kandeliae]|uniref:amidase family protein n=1 Tax=Acuticoccus kandeliae TaxID=2073160 RepID=UPI000D3ED730|nr:amidase family protein [Acuticoccus kandeliae]
MHDPAPDPFHAFVDRIADPGPGPRVAVKDMIAVVGCRQTAGLAVHADRRARADAAIVTAFRARRYAIAGTTFTDAAGFGTMTDPVQNPRAPGRAVGGSSGGSAAAVAAGLAEIGLGTDTGGSGRIPAAYCELFAYKPSLGRSDMGGIVPLAPTFDTPAILAADLTRLAAAAPAIVTEWRDGGAGEAALYHDVDGIGRADPAVVAAFRYALDRLPKSRPRRSPVRYEPMSMAHSAVVCAEGRAVHGAAFAAHPEGFPLIAARALAHAEAMSAREVEVARAMVDDARSLLREAIGPNDILILPTLPMPPAPRYARFVNIGRQREPVTNANIRFTLAASVAGLPVVVAPVAGLSLQFIGAFGRDEWLLASVAAILAGRTG